MRTYTIKYDKYKCILKRKGGIPENIDAILEDKCSIVYFEEGERFPIKLKLYERGTFYAGLYRFIIKMLKNMDYECELINKPIDNLNIAEKLNYVSENLQYNLRDYQKRAVVKAVERKLSAISMPTGSGKSVVIASLLLADNTDTLIIVDSVTLMYQLASDIDNATGKKCGLIGDGNFAPRKWTLAVIDSLLSPKGKEMVRNVKALYFDEAHKAGADTYKRIVDYGKDNVEIRRGFSATIFRNDSRSLLLPAMTGPIVVHYTTSEIIDKGYLAVPNIIMPRIKKPLVYGHNMNYVYNKCIIDNQLRNRVGVELLVDAAKSGELCAGIFRNVQKHLPKLKSLLFKIYNPKKIAIIHGAVPSFRRKSLLKEFANGDKTILLASVGTTGEGIDLPGQTSVGVNFVGGASEISTRQMLGRFLRKPKQKNGEVDTNMKYTIMYYCFYDMTNHIVERHSEIRYNTYDSESAFILEKR